ncbi:hypothetical protein KORDIASMS9_00839 [Kordia sp. SMS9]|nr:hypothetical protein KORDIASMS9_00839 [Kordia sp. SMS9]
MKAIDQLQQYQTENTQLIVGGFIIEEGGGI